MPSIDDVRTVLSQTLDPQMNQPLTQMNMVKEVKVQEGVVSVSIELKIPNYPFEKELKESVQTNIQKLPGVEGVNVAFTTALMRTPAAKEVLPGVKNIIAVYACKGGVGKSTTATNLSIALQKEGLRVGLLDADIHGPNIPLMMGIQENPSGTDDNKLIPLESHGVQLMSLGFLTETKLPSIWRGPMVHGAVQQLLKDTKWDNLDVLVVDLPPGTGDAQLTIAQAVPLSGVVLVTTPQTVSLVDGIKGIGMFQKFKVPILGMIENMSGFTCAHCQNVTNIFSKDGGKKEAERLGLPFLGAIPIEPEVVAGGDSGKPAVVSAPESQAAKQFGEIARNLGAKLKLPK